jgi:hypothetical protein
MENKVDILSQVFESKNVKMVTKFHEDECGEKEFVPWFCGRDVCKILEYSNYRQSINLYIDDECKYSLKELGVLSDKTPQKDKFTHNELQQTYINEEGLYRLINGSQNFKNKKKFISQIEKWIVDLRYGSNSGLADIFSFIKGYNLTFDITSDWFQDLWYPLSKNQPALQGGLTKVENRPIIITQKMLEWMGYKGRDQSDKQKNFCKLLRNLEIPYDEIGYDHPLAIEYPCVQREAQLIPANNITRKKWISMDVKAFKKAVLRLNTENAEIVRDYYLNLEEAMFAYGEYTMRYMIEKTERTRKVQDSQLSLAMEQLAIKDKSYEEETKELQNQLDQEKLRAERAEKEVEEQKQYALILKELAINDQKRPLDERIYISTSKAYAGHNRFKVGGVESMDKLKPRFSGYNGRSSVDDMWYYSDLFKVANFKAAEKRIEDVLGRFRERKNKEIYVLHYKDLRRYVEWICDHYEDEIEKFNIELDVLIGNLNRHQLRPVIPPPYEGTSAVITRFVDGVPVNTTIESTIEDKFKHKIKVYLDTLTSTTKEVKRTELFSKVDFNFNKIEAWCNHFF